MASGEAVPTRDRVVAAAMRLFGEQGYAGTSVAAIEAAAGLSPGSGGLYKHFRSKADILAEGIRRLVEQGAELRALLDTAPQPAGPAAPPIRERLLLVIHAGLRRLEEDRDFNRILMRDLKAFPDLLALAGEGEIAGNHRRLAGWLAAGADPGTGTEADPGEGGGGPDWEALAAVAMDAVAHYWLLRDVFGGTHPTGVSQERYAAALADLFATRLTSPDPAPQPPDHPDHPGPARRGGGHPQSDPHEGRPT